ncbi:hypothetical protein EYV94_00660 [Puteibacter caeruleilacunae]|nr:hypothetical protein EYV94_00660 [Puteibacter caeruleilacunae]
MTRQIILFIVFCCSVATKVSIAASLTHQTDVNNQKVVAFTFDDGPSPETTIQILDLFEKVNGKATFFNIGDKLAKHPEISKEVIARGHEIGNHSMSHDRMYTYTDGKKVGGEINGFQVLSGKLLDYQPKLFRAPFLKTNALMQDEINALRLKYIEASVFAKDAKAHVAVEEVVSNIKVKSGDIVLCHERKHTIDALKIILPKLKAEGFKFITVSDLLATCKVIPANDTMIKITGSNYTRMEGGLMIFPRHSKEVLNMPTKESKISAKRAQTTTGVKVSFLTASPKVTLKFQALEGENRGATFGIFQNKKFVKSVSFKKTDGPLLSFDVNSTDPDKEVLHEISLPNWCNVAFQGLMLDDGHTLKKIPTGSKPVYVAYGNSITHGTGQQASYQTYPFYVANAMNWELYNLAVGGARTSVPMAQMISDDFQQINYMTILIGYNDYNGEGISAKEYGERLTTFIKTIRQKHHTTKLFCITPTYTRTKQSKKSDEKITAFREAMESVVQLRETDGDDHIFLIHGENITTDADLNDAVHLNIEGANRFGNKLVNEMKKIIND